MNVGKQAGLAAALLMLAAGCSGETDAAEPVAEDLCSNIDGDQVDSGLYIIEDGDVCTEVTTDDATQPLAGQDTGEEPHVATGPAATINAWLESPTGTEINVIYEIGAPLNGAEALATPAGQELQAGCGNPNLHAYLDSVSTQVVPITWQAIDFTTGGFSWEAPFMENLVLPESALTVSDAIRTQSLSWSGECAPGDDRIRFTAGSGLAFAWRKDVYTPNSPNTGFDLYGFQVGVRGGVTDCEITVNEDVFGPSVRTVDTAKECMITNVEDDSVF